jgi:Thioesterase-like superfamily
MTSTADPLPDSAFTALDDRTFRASLLTRGPWDPGHQHAGPPIALVCRAIERAAHVHGLTHLSRITANLLRPVPIDLLSLEIGTDYTGRNAGHFSARLFAQGKEVARFTALAQRENDLALPDELPGHPLPTAAQPPESSPPAVFPFASSRRIGYADLVETRLVHGRFFAGPCAAWFRLRHPLVHGESPSAYQRVAVAADSGNGISAVLDFSRYLFVNSDLTINLLRRPHGEWICLDARTHLGSAGCGLTESRLYDSNGLIGLATQSLAVRARE